MFTCSHRNRSIPTRGVVTGGGGGWGHVPHPHKFPVSLKSCLMWNKLTEENFRFHEKVRPPVPPPPSHWKSASYTPLNSDIDHWCSLTHNFQFRISVHFMVYFSSGVTCFLFPNPRRFGDIIKLRRCSLSFWAMRWISPHCYFKTISFTLRRRKTDPMIRHSSQ